MIELLTVAFPIVLAGVFGYVLGLLRDVNKSKADREARHQDAVLEAASALLALCNVSAKASVKFQTSASSKPDLLKDADSVPGFRELAQKAEREAGEALTELDEKMREAQPFRLKLRILAPSLTDVITRLIETANSVVRYGPPTGGPTNLSMDDYKNVADEYTAKVQDFLKVKKPKTQDSEDPRGHRPLYGMMSDDYSG